MAEPARRLIIPLLLATSLAFVECAFAQTAGRDPLGAARDLYASARYDEALSVLNDLHAPDAAAPDRKSIEQYRSLCLLALGRASEAESAITAVITADPTYLPKEDEASPRVRAAFSDVRKRILPQIATERYADAKTLFDKKMFAAASQQFKNVIKLIDDPDMGGREADLRTLASGFLDLAVAATAPPPEAPKPVAPAPVAAPPPPAPKPDLLRIYSIADKDVTPPVILRQDMPSLTQIVKLQASDKGIVEIVIDQAGRVEAVTVRQSVHPRYDAQLLSAAQNWRYSPATWNGQPVKYRKMIQINVSK
ncbi:MAG TPA: TonB family protein [Vicinamibacterales bacterium]|nr:TonB family protein [Vicinamibacterales bacterium]